MRKVLKLFKKYLGKNKLMSVCTQGEKEPWCAIVFFAFDDNFNFIFASKKDTIHAKNIIKNKNVSLSIYQDWGRPWKLKGAQIKGVAKVLREESKEYSKFYNIFKKRYKWIEKFPDHKIFIVKPKEIWWTNHVLFKTIERQRIL